MTAKRRADGPAKRRADGPAVKRKPTPPGAGKRLVMPSMEMNFSAGVVMSAHSGKVTRRVSRASSWSSTMPTKPISKIAVITLVIDKLFHSFQTK